MEFSSSMMAVPSYSASSGLASTVTLKALLGGSESPELRCPSHARSLRKDHVPYGIDFVDRAPPNAVRFRPPNTRANSLSSKTAESPRQAPG